MLDPAPKLQPMWLLATTLETAATFRDKLPRDFQQCFKSMTTSTAVRLLRRGTRPNGIFIAGEPGRVAQEIFAHINDIAASVPVFLMMHWKDGGDMRSWLSRMVGESVQRPGTEGLDSSLNSYGLSSRELQVLRFMVQGLIKKEIAEQMSISYHTVNNHECSIYRKLKIHTRSAAVAKALMERIC